MISLMLRQAFHSSIQLICASTVPDTMLGARFTAVNGGFLSSRSSPSNTDCGL